MPPTPPLPPTTHPKHNPPPLNPEVNYHIASITDNGAAKTITNPYVMTNVTAAHTVVVTFAQDVSPSATWYLAEGSTDWGFDCYISIENPNTEAVNVKLTYMTSTGPVTGPTVKMPALTQATVFPSATLGAKDFSTKVECAEGKLISVDRTMYWTGTGRPLPRGPLRHRGDRPRHHLVHAGRFL